MYTPNNEELSMMLEILENGRGDLLADLSDDSWAWLMTLLRVVKGCRRVTVEEMQAMYQACREEIAK